MKRNFDGISVEPCNDTKPKAQCIGSITKLPDEVLLKIFGFLSTFDILRNVALVCKDFNRISKDSQLIKEISLTGCNSPIRANYGELYDFIKNSQSLRKLRISQRADAEKLLSTALNSSKKIENLELEGCIMSEEMMDEIIGLGQNIQYLKLAGSDYCCWGCEPDYGFNFNFDNFDDETLEYDELPDNFQFIRNRTKIIYQIPNHILCQVNLLKNLRHLDLKNCEEFFSGDLVLLANNCENLETLYLELVSIAEILLQIFKRYL